MKVNMHWATNPSWARAIMTLLPWWLSFKLSWQSCKTTKTTKMDIWHSISTTFLDFPQVWTKLVSVPDPKPTPAQIAFSILKAIYVPDDETRMKTAQGLGTVVSPQTPPTRGSLVTSGWFLGLRIDCFLERNCSLPITLQKTQSVEQHWKSLATLAQLMTQHFFLDT